MSDIVHVGLNEGPPQYFRPYERHQPAWWTRAVPRTAWNAYEESKLHLEAAEVAHAAALQQLLDAMKASPRTRDDDHIDEYVVVDDRIYWP